MRSTQTYEKIFGREKKFPPTPCLYDMPYFRICMALRFP